MNFNFTSEQALIAQTFLDHGRAFEKERVIKNVARSGLLGLCIAKEFGGLGFGALDTALALEAFSKGSNNTGLAFSIAAHLLACAKPIELFASDALKKKYLPLLCSGEKIGAQAMTELEAGSDVSLLKTRAEKREGHYILNGTKCYITNAPLADCILLYATTNPEAGYKGVSAFLIDATTPGFTRSNDLEKLGPVDSTLGEVHFSNCSVPESHRIGEEGEGATIFKSTMHWERACLFAIYLGQMEAELEHVIDHATHRKQFGKAIGKNQAISHRIANMKIRLESAKWLLYHACWKLDQGVDASLEISIAKVAVSEAAVESSLGAIQILGASGVLSEKGLKNAVPSTIFSGTSEMHRDIIARILGL